MKRGGYRRQLRLENGNARQWGVLAFLSEVCFVGHAMMPREIMRIYFSSFQPAVSALVRWACIDDRVFEADGVRHILTSQDGVCL